LESVLELAVDGLQVAHTAGTGALAALGLLAPVDYCSKKDKYHAVCKGSEWLSRTFPDLSRRVTAVGTGVLLDVQRSLSY
jgi:hypothetical protein